MRKLKELGLTESLAIGYRLSPRGEVVVDKLRGAASQASAAPATGTPLPRADRRPGHPGPAGRRTDVAWSRSAAVTEAELSAMHGVGPIAIARLREALADAGLAYRPT